MKITLAQINTTPNDFSGNFQKIMNGVSAAITEKADVVVFPELTIPGYLVKDLVYTSGFVEKNLEYLQDVAKLTFNNSLTVIVGYIDRNHKGIGKPFKNMAAVIRGGVVIATYQKHLLPFYDVFDEGRYFEPGTDICVFDINGSRCGIAICEDVWNDKGQDDYCYEDNPVQKYRELGINYIFSLNSSPYAKFKPQHRIDMLSAITGDWKNANGTVCPINLVYVNQIGGQDELVFDGHSMIVSNGGVVEYIRTPVLPTEYGDSFVTTVIKDKNSSGPYINYDFETDHLRIILLGLRDYIKKCGFTQVVLGSSGGVDSALVATLASLAIGAENVNCIMMPSCYSSEGSVKDAKELHKRLGCNEFFVPIEHRNLTNHINTCFKFIERDPENDIRYTTVPVEAYKKLVQYNESADENIQARMRGQIIMHFSNAVNALALTTGNKSELSVGYTTLYGDSCGGFNPIGDAFKTEVFAICKQINILFNGLIPSEILTKAPSAELKPDQTDEKSLLPYPILDELLRLYVEEYVTDYKLYTIKANGIVAEEKDFNRITRLIYINEFKRRQVAPTIKLSKVAFGTGRRLPIVKK